MKILAVYGSNFAQAEAVLCQHGGPTVTAREFKFSDWDALDPFAAELSDGLLLSSPNLA